MHQTTYHTYALVAGGSRGIGFAIANALAKRGFNLVLIARGAEDLAKAKNTLEQKFGIRVETISRDLSLEESAEVIGKWVNDKQVALKMLCNVVGIGGAEDYLLLPPERLWYMTRLNAGSAMSLTLRLLANLERNNPSYILNVASMAGFAPMPIKNIYSATKSSVIFFSYSLRYQLKERNISVSCLAPGPVFTRPEIKAETIKRLGKFGLAMAMDPAKVGEIAVRRTLAGRMLIVPGKLAKITAFLLRILPKRVATFIYYKLGR